MESLRKLIDIVEQGRLPAPMEPTYKPGPGGQLIPDIDVNLNPDMKSTRPRTPASSTLPPLDAPMEPTYKKGPGGQLVPDIDYKLNPGMKPQSGTVTPPKPASRPQPAAPRNTPKMPTVPQPGAAIKKITEHDIDQEVAAIIEEINKVAEGGPFSYGKAPRKGSVADLAAKKRREQEKGKQPVEPKDQMVGVAKVTKGVAEGSITEASKDFAERYYAGKEMEEILDNLRSSESPNVTLEIIKRIKNLVAITGRGQTISGFGSAGELLDKLTDMYRQSQIRLGQMPQFTGRASTARDMARQIANQTRGTYRYLKPESWTHSSGQRYRDPADYVVYPDQQSYDDALEWIENKGKKVRYRDHFRNLTDATQIGRYIIEPSSFTQGAFSDTPETTHRISVRLAKTINQGGREQVDISDQQAAALHDIAATRSANAMQSIQSIMAVLGGMEDVKRVIANSKKIHPQDKAKLDAIIANAGKFQEPGGQQGVAEGVDIGQEWMSDTELDQYVPERLQQQWRELLGYDKNGNPSALWANLTGGYEPDVNDPQHRRLMVKVANKWFAAKKIPNVKFFDVKDADDELEWLVQIGQQGVAESRGSKTDYIDLDGDGNRKESMKKAAADQQHQKSAK